MTIEKTVTHVDHTEQITDLGRRDPRVGQESYPPGTLSLVVTLCHELRAAAVRYCHWKSNDMLHRSASGENDLDLLIHRRDVRRFHRVLAHLGFRHAVAPGGREHPGVSHHYALDVESGKFVHIHAHVMLVLGDDTTKNFRLPIEVPYLESCRHDEIFPIPAAEFELAVFVVRMILKHATWDAVAIGKGTIAAGERRELDWLLERADPVGTREVVRTHLGGIGVDLWEDCLAAVRGPAQLGSRLLTGRRLLRALRPHARRSWPHDLSLRVIRRGTWGGRRYVLRQQTRKRLAQAGGTVAIVGGDGAGKSTAVESTCAWLGGPLAVRRVHLGKPRPSLLTLGVKGPMYAARAAGLLPSAGRVIDPRTATPEEFPGDAWALWHLFTARDRLRDYRRARRFADNGGIVVSDRWPLSEITLMDGPRTTWVLRTPERFGPTTLWIARHEDRIYRQIARPDVLVVLQLDPRIAVARRSDEDGEAVLIRNTEVRDADWSRSHAAVVDASRPADEVLAAIRRIVWERL
jgi:thymidylate kinase